MPGEAHRGELMLGLHVAMAENTWVKHTWVHANEMQSTTWLWAKQISTSAVTEHYTFISKTMLLVTLHLVVSKNRGAPKMEGLYKNSHMSITKKWWNSWVITGGTPSYEKPRFRCRKTEQAGGHHLRADEPKLQTGIARSSGPDRTQPIRGTCRFLMDNWI